MLRGRLREVRASHHPPSDDVVRLAEHHPALFSEVASAFWEAGRLHEALLWLEKALGRSESPAERAFLLTRAGAAYLRLGGLREALEILQRALGEDDNPYSALQLGNVLRYLGRYEEAEARLEHAWAGAKAAGDGALAVAVLCASAEWSLDQSRGQEAAERFGRALGLTEFSSDDRLTVAPLAGLGHAHAVWGYPAKGRAVARRALERAETAHDRVGAARALLALGVAGEDAGTLERAEREAQAAPHAPLRLRAWVARLELRPDKGVADALALAKELEMHPDVTRLERIQEVINMARLRVSEGVAPKVIAVFGASVAEPGGPEWREAETLGADLAKAGFALATGGYGGLMEAVSKGYAEAGGEHAVIGVSAPRVFPKRAGVNPYVAQEIAAETLLERIHQITDLSAAAVALPGAIGTLTEIMVAWNLSAVAPFSSLEPKPLVTVGARWARVVGFVAEELHISREGVYTVEHSPAVTPLLHTLLRPS